MEWLGVFSIINSQDPMVFKFGEMCRGQANLGDSFIFCAMQWAKQQLLQGFQPSSACDGIAPYCFADCVIF